MEEVIKLYKAGLSSYKISKELNISATQIRRILHKNKVEIRSTKTSNEIEKEIDRCNKQIHSLHSALINLEIEREIGRLSSDSYEKALGIIQWGLKGVNAEKSDLDVLRSKLSNLLLGEKTQNTPEGIQTKAPEQTELPKVPAPVSTNLPEPPVIIHVRNTSNQSS